MLCIFRYFLFICTVFAFHSAFSQDENKSSTPKSGKPELVVKVLPSVCLKGEGVKVVSGIFIPGKDENTCTFEANDFVAFRQMLLPPECWEEKKDPAAYGVKDTLLHSVHGRWIELYHGFWFPQKSGKIQVPALKIPYKIHTENTPKNNDKIAEKKSAKFKSDTVVSGPFSLNVNNLPSTDLLNAFLPGKNFRMEVDFSDTLPYTGDMITLKVSITGKGNIAQIPKPFIRIPKSFYYNEPAALTNLSSSQEGVEGTRQFIYELYPSRPGDYTLSSISWYFFNTQLNRYDSLVFPQKTIRVTGEGEISESEGNDREVFYQQVLKEDYSAWTLPGKYRMMFLFPLLFIIIWAGYRASKKLF